MSTLLDRPAYRRLVADLSVGKRLPEAVYLHESLVGALPEALLTVVRRAGQLAPEAHGVANVFKLAAGVQRVSLLAYPAFFDAAFPTLHTAWTVDLEAETVRFRDYRSDANPPVLHRKERLLPADHPSVPAFAELTATAERMGLFEDVATIGLSRGWEDRLRVCGVRVDGHALVPLVPHGLAGPSPLIARHRTALHRRTLSTPMQLLARHGYLDGTRTIFDYGCGRGDDVATLRERGLTAWGWDPHFAPAEAKRSADLVNLGFVLNVIEDLAERKEALGGAYALAERLLVVAALLSGRMVVERRRLYRDGVVTERGTFQKYFAQGELRAYIEQSLAREPIAVAPGVFFVFRDDDEEQRFLAARQTRTPLSAPWRAPRSTPKPRATAAARATRTIRVRPDPWAAYADLLDAFYTRSLALARLPERDEFDRWSELEDVGSVAAVWRRLIATHGAAAFEAAQAARRDDVLVYLALNVFERRRSVAAPPEDVRRDIRALWGTLAAAQTAATELLHSIARPAAILDACRRAAAAGVGFLDGEHSLQLHTSLAPRLPPLLRVYLACAARLYGDVESADLVKIHVTSAKVSLMTYDDFDGRPVPDLLERVKINLRTQEIDFFEYGDAHPPQPLYLKSRYLAPDVLGYDEQLEFDRALEALGVFDFRDFGPSREAFYSGLQARGYEIDGFALRDLTGPTAAAPRAVT